MSPPAISPEKGTPEYPAPPDPFTDPSPEEAFLHIIKEVLNQPINGQLAWVLEDNGYPKHPDAFLMVDDWEIESFKFAPEAEREPANNRNEPTLLIFKYHAAVLHKAVAFANAKQEENGSIPLPPDQWMGIRHSEFMRWCKDVYLPSLKPATRAPAPAMAPTTTAVSAATKSRASEFRRTIKKDIGQYPVMKSDLQWDSIRRTVQSLA